MVFVFHSNPGDRYTILKSQKFNWQIFNLNDLTLGRWDINYILLNQIINESNLLSFFKKSADKLKSCYTNSITQTIGTTLKTKYTNGWFLDSIFLKFELEIKKYKAKQVTPFLINNCFAEFENSVVDSFLWYLKIALVFDTCYTSFYS